MVERGAWERSEVEQEPRMSRGGGESLVALLVQVLREGDAD